MLLEYLDGKRHRYALEDRLRESLDDVDFDTNESDNTERVPSTPAGVD